MIREPKDKLKKVDILLDMTLKNKKSIKFREYFQKNTSLSL